MDNVADGDDRCEPNDFFFRDEGARWDISKGNQFVRLLFEPRLSAGRRRRIVSTFKRWKNGRQRNCGPRSKAFRQKLCVSAEGRQPACTNTTKQPTCSNGNLPGQKPPLIGLLLSFGQSSTRNHDSFQGLNTGAGSPTRGAFLLRGTTNPIKGKRKADIGSEFFSSGGVERAGRWAQLFRRGLGPAKTSAQ